MIDCMRITPPLLFVIYFLAGCSSVNPDEDHRDLSDVIRRASRVHEGMTRLEVDDTLKPFEVLGGANVSGIEPTLYQLSTDVVIWLQFTRHPEAAASSNDRLLHTPGSISVNVGKAGARHKKWKDLPIRIQN